MSNQQTRRQRLWNRFYAIPAVAQWWARRRAGETAALVEEQNGIPFARLRKPLAAARGALITTAGVHLRSQPPFDMVNPDGDASYRTIPGAARGEALTITHNYYDHTAADRDLNVVFPLEHFHTLAAQGVIGGVAPRHFGFMGHIDGPLIAALTEGSAPAVAARLRADDVDFAFLTPA
jgi:D-proline reductase (dithiol) PrdB